jgi:ribosomal protein S18 acetylase RimI-like enzyme
MVLQACSIAGSARRIRKACAEDIMDLVEICAGGFPSSVCWNSRRWLARRWWETALAGAAAEAWVVEVDRGVAALCVLILNEAAWREQNKRRGGFGPLWVFSAMCHPIVAYRQMLAAIRNARTTTVPAPCNRQAPVGWGPTMRTWVELIAVASHQRGSGLAGMLLNHCCSRTAELGRSAIALRVDFRNTPAKRLYEKHGFVRYHADGKGEYYLKTLEI